MGVGQAIIDRFVLGRPGRKSIDQSIIDMLVPGRQEKKAEKAQKKIDAESQRAKILAEQKAEDERLKSVRTAVLSGSPTGILNPATTSTRSRLLGN